MPGAHDGHSALVVVVPALDELVTGPLRRWAPDYLGVGRCGAAPFVRAHITVLSPWLPLGRMTGDEAATALTELRGALAGAAPFEASLATVTRFADSGLTCVEPEPRGRFEALTAAVVARWPGLPPYDGRFGAVTPHLSVDHTTPADLPRLRREIAGHLPVQLQVSEVHAHWYAPGDTRCLGSAPLGG